MTNFDTARHAQLEVQAVPQLPEPLFPGGLFSGGLFFEGLFSEVQD